MSILPISIHNVTSYLSQMQQFVVSKYVTDVLFQIADQDKKDLRLELEMDLAVQIILGLASM